MIILTQELRENKAACRLGGVTSMGTMGIVVVVIKGRTQKMFRTPSHTPSNFTEWQISSLPLFLFMKSVFFDLTVL